MKTLLVVLGLLVTTASQAHTGHVHAAMDQYTGYLHIFLAHPELLLAALGAVALIARRTFVDK